jgi:hypothetical protein
MTKICIPVKARYFSSQRALEVILELKLVGHKADHLPPSSTEAMNRWSYTSKPPIHLSTTVRASKLNQNIYYNMCSSLMHVLQFRRSILQP